MIKLEKFDRNDFERLISWISNDRFLLQWGGPQYTFPLDVKQLEDTLSMAYGKQPKHIVFKAIDDDTNDVVGHVELMRIDYSKKTSHIGRVLIGESEVRRKGKGSLMLKQLIRFAFDDMGFDSLTLAVFDFNESAIQCYKKLGFKQIEFRKNARNYREEYWNLIIMKLCKTT